MFNLYSGINLPGSPPGLPTGPGKLTVDAAGTSISGIATSVLERIRRTISRVFGSRGPVEGMRLRREIIGYYEKGNYREATEAARRLLDLQKQEVGEHHPDYATGLLNLSLLLLKQGDARGASTFLEEAVSVRRSALGADHLDTSAAESLLATVRDVTTFADPAMLGALAVLDGVLGLVYTGRGELASLRDCQAIARALRESVASGTSGVEVGRLNGGEHPFALLLTFVGSRDRLTDAEWATFYESVSATLGRSLARAVSRGQVRDG